MDFDYNPAAENYNIPKQKGFGKGGSKSLEDSHDPGASPYAIEIIYKKENVPNPMYYNFASSAQLPANVVNGKTELIDDGVRPLQMSTGEHYDLAIDSNLSEQKSLGRVGLAEITGYRLVNVDLYDWRDRRVSDSDFRVYEIPGKHQVYAKIAQSSWGPYTFAPTISGRLSNIRPIIWCPSWIPLC